MTGLAFTVKDTSSFAIADYNALGGLYYSGAFLGEINADIFSFYNKSKLPLSYAGVTAPNHDLIYLGQRLHGKVGAFFYEEEFIFQAGELHDKTSKAFQVGLRLGAATGAHKGSIRFDLLSGDGNPTDSDATAYIPAFAFAHNYFGWMDYFVANPPNGVMDFRVDADLALGSKAVLKPQYHFFLLANPKPNQGKSFGQEIDLELHLSLYPKSNLVFGAALFIPGESAARLPAARAGNDKPGYFLYFMPVFNF